MKSWNAFGDDVKFSCGSSKMKDSMESFLIDIRTEIRDEPKEMNKSIKSEMETGMRTESPFQTFARVGRPPMNVMKTSGCALA